MKWKLHPAFLGRCDTFLDLVAVEVKCVEEEVSCGKGPLPLRMFTAVIQQSLIISHVTR